MKYSNILMLGALLALSPMTSYATEPNNPNYPADLNESDANIIGHVIDSNTGEHLSYISVALKGTTIGAMTDNTGHFFLKNLPEGKFTIVVSAVGYKPVTRQVVIKKGKTQEINFEIMEDLVTLDGVVVSANRNETTRRIAPTLVNVIDMKMFDATNSCNLAQGLNFQPGVRVENNCQNCGFQQVRINGLDGPYTQILIDSRPVFSALAGVYGLEQIPANMVERVEVMRGGGSALFGSSAIAGTINIITKEPVRNSAAFAHTITNIDANGAWDNNTTVNASLVTDNHKMGLYVFGQNRKRDGYDKDGDGFTELPTLHNQTIGMRSFLKTSTYSRITAEYHHLQEYRRGGDMLDRPPHEANIAEQLTHSIDNANLKFDYFSPNERHMLSTFISMQHVKRNSYYGGNQNPDAYGYTQDLTWMAGAQYNLKFDKCLFMPATMTAGLEYNEDRLDDYMRAYDREHFHQNVRIASAFLQNEWKNEHWGFLLGGRLDKHNLIDHLIFSPRVNLRYNPTKNINLRASYSFGFRAPQAFDEDLHIENVGGTVSIIRLAKNLKEEKSQSLSVSADMYGNWGNWQGNLLVEGFYTRLSDVFTLKDINNPEGDVLIKERGNEKGAQVYGLTLEGKIAYKKMLQLQAGATLQRSRYMEARAWIKDQNVPMEKRMFRTPDIYGYFTMTYNPVEPLSLALSGTYTGSMLVEHHEGWIDTNRTEKTPDFMDISFKAGYDFKLYKSITLQLNAGVQNIFNAYQDDFDKSKDRDSAYIYGPGTPRCFFAGIKLTY